MFHRCYELVPNGFSAPTWHLVALPDAGAMADQDAWLMAALAFARDVMDRLTSDLVKTETDKRRHAPRRDETPDDHGD